jgi:hypothetical protein
MADITKALKKKLEADPIAGWDFNRAGGEPGRLKVARGKKLSPADKVSIGRSTWKSRHTGKGKGRLVRLSKKRQEELIREARRKKGTS